MLKREKTIMFTVIEDTNSNSNLHFMYDVHTYSLIYGEMCISSINFVFIHILFSISYRHNSCNMCCKVDIRSYRISQL